MAKNMLAFSGLGREDLYNGHGRDHNNADSGSSGHKWIQYIQYHHVSSYIALSIFDQPPRMSKIPP